jgi:hypothetical protein
MTDCPPPFELLQSEALSPAQKVHLRSCRRCTALARALGGTAGEREVTEPATAIEWSHRPVADVLADPHPGAIHSIWGNEDGDLLAAVIIDVDDHEALVVPVSPETRLAAETDVLIDRSVLAYPAMLEVWNHAQVLPEQIMERIGELDEQLTTLVQDAVDAVIDSQSLPDGLTEGVAIIGEADPRRLFREAEARRAQKFLAPWRMLNAADTLGGVLSFARNEHELEPEAVATQVDLPAEVLTRLEADKQDLRQSVPIAHLQSLAQTFELCPSARLGHLVEEAVFANDRGTGVGAPVAMARRRRGARSAAPLLPEDVRREHARDYARQLLDRMRQTP